MVNSINSLRLLSVHSTMKTLHGGTATGSDASRSVSALADDSYRSVHSNSKLSILLNGLSKNHATTQTVVPQSAQKPNDNIASNDFMKALNARLKASSSDPVSGQQAKSMLNALKSGNLSVFDPTRGVAIDAWNPDDKNSKAGKPEAIAKDGWNEFLKEHLKRDGKGILIRTSDGSYLDKATGQNAFFGTVNGKYYYATWPTATAGEGTSPVKTGS